MNPNINNKIHPKNNSKINNTSSKPIKKMIIWTRITNSKSTSPHMKQEANPSLQYKNFKNLVKPNYSGQKIKNNSKENNTSSPSIKIKEVKNFINTNRNYFHNSRTNKNKLNSQLTSFQSNSNSNEENKSSSKIADSNSKPSEKKPHYFNNIKFRKYINMNFSLNNNTNNVNNINSSEYHVNNTYKYFQQSNGINLRKKNQNKIKNKTNFITDANININNTNNIFINHSKKSIKKKISKEKNKNKKNISKKNLLISPLPLDNPITQREKKILTGSLNQLTADNLNNLNIKIDNNKIRKNSLSERNNNNNINEIIYLEKIKNLGNIFAI